ncbi:N-acetylmuramoyl-L-alanine amidase AmiC [Defluviimonas aquaemixtae]|uniref:N-acetylmuramoyl-L-alanine amidase n=1 Tax=Albidovulum aquaemixtae TaxID=1542388 RepID=A0A2R8B4U2_9RHOB|nr:N-acetylmuramoyl-L-alanine amidase [Defluviimonas aquaemixtae]SPH17654.1 N-acetylmuramoyl-L-alanine amidase AmiC [Defluviimonas aquaemixtae]
MQYSRIVVLTWAVALAAVIGRAAPAAGTGDLTALARLDAAASALVDDGEGIALDLAISKAVPYRAFLLSDPPRLVLDFSELDFGPSRPAALDRSEGVAELGWGPIQPGWSRLVAILDGPYRIASAEQQVAETGAADIRVTLMPSTAATFATATAGGVPEVARWALPDAAETAPPRHRQTGENPLIVVLDPGHGGIDPGAESEEMVEADVMLTFARELAEVLRRGGMEVVLTRQEDVFVPLETRISIARASGADVFLSLHADALAEGEATGATVYKLADAASDTASARLAERHDRADLLAGVDLSGQDDLVAAVMMDLARTETRPRTDRLAEALVAAISGTGGRMHRHPIQEAAFSVLKSPDIPSVLLEVGFLSSEADRERLSDPDWRKTLQEAVLVALKAWAIADAAEARLLRQ